MTKTKTTEKLRASLIADSEAKVRGAIKTLRAIKTETTLAESKARSRAARDNIMAIFASWTKGR
jgi:hypothetical protein